MSNITDNVPNLPETGADVVFPESEVGVDVDTYLNAAAAATRAVNVMDALRPKLIKAGMEAVFSHNCNDVPLEKRVKTARLIGGHRPHERGVELLAICSDTSLKMDANKVTAALKAARTVDNKIPNPDRYVRYQAEAKFNAACFHDSDGKIDADKVNKITLAFEKAAKQLGIENPLTVSKKLVFTATWWTDRFERFDSETLVELCSGDVPQQVTLRKAE